MKLISFVIPCYRSEKTIKMVAQEIVETVSAKPEYDYEIITVNDCSPDNVLSVLKRLASENSKFKVIDLMQNGGKEAAVMAGLSVANGDFAITMDDDFQHPATEVWRLIEPIESGEYDVGTAYYDVKKESWLKRTCSDIYGFFSHTMLGQPKDIRLDSFMALSRKVYLEMLNYKNPYPFLDGLVLRVTKSIAMVKVEGRNRGDDNDSGYTFIKSFKLFMDGMTAFSIKPLRVASFVGFATAVVGFVFLIITVIHYYTDEVAVGFSSLMSVLLFIGGMLMMMIGLVGEYIGRIYICINQSPQYVIRDTININTDKTK